MIKINVGGKIFCTRAETLTEKSEYFKNIFSEKYDKKDSFYQEDGFKILFVDRDPETFEIVLHYLRTNSYKNINKIDVEQYNNEIDFYGINAPKLIKKYCYLSSDEYTITLYDDFDKTIECKNRADIFKHLSINNYEYSLEYLTYHTKYGRDDSKYPNVKYYVYFKIVEKIEEKSENE